MFFLCVYIDIYMERPTKVNVEFYPYNSLGHGISLLFGISFFLRMGCIVSGHTYTHKLKDFLLRFYFIEATMRLVVAHIFPTTSKRIGLVVGVAVLACDLQNEKK